MAMVDEVCVGRDIDMMVCGRHTLRTWVLGVGEYDREDHEHDLLECIDRTADDGNTDLCHRPSGNRCRIDGQWVSVLWSSSSSTVPTGHMYLGIC